MKKLVIITISCLFLFSLISCASVEKKSEVPNPANPVTVQSEDFDPILWYIKKVKKDPVEETLGWLEAFDLLPNPFK